MLMVLSCGKGRIFHTTLRHDALALATGKVTQKVPKNFPATDTVSYRADLAAVDPEIARGTAE